MDVEEYLEEVEQNVQDKLEGLANRVEQKLAIPRSEIIQEFKDEVERLTEALDVDDERIIERRAWARIRGAWKQELMSNAEVFEGVVFGASDPFDMNAPRRYQAEQAYEDDPKKAINEGYVNEDGEPLDTNGNLIQSPDWIRNIVGVKKPIDGDDVTLFKMTMSGNNAKEVNIPTFTPVRFRANVTGNEENGYEVLNSWTRQSFEEIDADFTVEDVLDTPEAKRIMIDLNDIRTWHNEHVGTYDEIMMVEGDVAYIDSEPNRVTGNLRMVLDSDDIGETDQYTVWLPEHLHGAADFAAGSKVIVAGSTGENEFGGEIDYMINAWGLYAYPELKIPARNEDAELGSYDQII